MAYASKWVQRPSSVSDDDGWSLLEHPSSEPRAALDSSSHSLHLQIETDEVQKHPASNDLMDAPPACSKPVMEEVKAGRTDIIARLVSPQAF